MCCSASTLQTWRVSAVPPLLPGLFLPVQAPPGLRTCPVRASRATFNILTHFSPALAAPHFSLESPNSIPSSPSAFPAPRTLSPLSLVFIRSRAAWQSLIHVDWEIGFLQFYFSHGYSLPVATRLSHVTGFPNTCCLSRWMSQRVSPLMHMVAHLTLSQGSRTC